VSSKDEGARRCSFCNKAEEDVGKLVAGPDSLPRACICDECIQVCCQLLGDYQPGKVVGHPVRGHPLLGHPHAADLLDAIVAWVGRPEASELDRVRQMAQAMVRES
jgi:hypothetical protein